ncbi:hypothetical protein [Frondihabitans peucedani]|uniref:Uncharacterized protein n=1 Tax=Frondihabitans peucedani TaxID=598626 RepID=A0ABP8E1R9_9MICO
MLVTTLRIDGQEFFLPDEADIDQIKERVLAAAREGAGFVDFTVRDQGRISVLMTPRVAVRFEVVDRSEAETAGWDDDHGSFEFDPATFIS